MLRRLVCVTVLVIAAATGCEKRSVIPSAAVLPATRAAAVGELSDNPLLAFVPSDTPYAFATFRPMPAEVIGKMTGVAKPIWRRILTRLAEQPGQADQQRVLQDVLDLLDTVDVKRFEDAGFSAKARGVIYGLGPYPVLRVELSSGDRVAELVQRTAARWNKTLPPAIERAGRRYWVVDVPPVAMFVAIAPKQLVAAFAPRDVIDGNLAALLGEAPVASHLTTVQFRAIAERDGFTGQGVGFADVARVGALIASSAGAAPDCQAAVAAIARRAPRFALGYDELTTRRSAFGMVLELAPDAAADARGLSGSLVGLDRALAGKPAMAFGVAVNLDHARALLARIGGGLQDLGRRCEVQGLVDAATSMVSTATRPLPPFLAGLRGGYVALTRITMGARGPESIEGFGTLQLDHADPLLKLAAIKMPELDVSTDGKPHALPPAIPFPGHIAASETTIGVGLGSNSATTAVAGLQGTSAPAPLLVIQYDYSRLAELILARQQGVDAQNMRDLLKLFGLATIQLVVDERGAVMWTAVDMH